jgi:uncharacterized membrane protein YdjX (TVP38/TMEM64 family)
MRPLFRWSLVVLLVLAVPIVPFVGFGAAAESWIQTRLDQSVSAPRAAMFVIGVLATDVFLPVPSSAVSTFAGQRLGIVGGALASWIGMTLGAVVAFALARRFGKPLAERLAGPVELARMERLTDRHGTRLIVITRALPVLAEASVLVMGAARLSWRKFLPAAMLSNLGLSAVYATCGALSREAGIELTALIASIALPLLAAALAKRFWPAPETVASA